jgi:hypothetical protein
MNAMPRENVMRIVGALLLFLSIVTAGCDDRAAAQSTAPKGADLAIGSKCTVQFRRDALGGAGALPVPPLSNVVNGAEVSVAGKLVKADADWIVLSREREHDEIWIPRHNVLLVQLPGK